MQTFCERLIERDIPISWRCSSRADTIDEEMILLMKKAGLTSIVFGIETGSERIQKMIHKKLNINMTRKMLQLCLDSGVKVTASFMYGFPQETEFDASETLNLMCDLLDMGVQRVQAHLVDFLQGTELFDKYKSELVFDGQVSNMATRFGISDCSFMLQNSDIFSAFFDYPSELRFMLDRIEDFLRCYMRFRSSMRQVRVLMGGDAMAMYKSFKNAVTSLEIRKGGKNEGLRVRKSRDLREGDIKMVKEFFSRVERSVMGGISVVFAEEENGGILST